MGKAFYNEVINRCQTIDGLSTDLENVLEAMDTIREADRHENWLLAYLRDETTALQMLATKRDFIVSLIRQQVAQAWPEADPNDVEVELADYRNVLAIVTYANEPEEIDKLVNAMADISDRFSDEGEPLPPGEKLPPQPDYVLSPRAAYFNERERVPWVETRGRIVAEMIAPYPPGIPVIYQGERMSAEVWDYIEAFRQRNGHIHGPSDPTLSTLMVIKE